MTMNYKELAEDALDIGKRATHAGIAADHMARAQVYATLYLAEQQNMSNRMQYAIDFATGDEHYAELGREIGAMLGVKPQSPASETYEPTPRRDDVTGEELAPWNRPGGCFGHCDPEGWAKCRDSEATS